MTFHGSNAGSENAYHGMLRMPYNCLSKLEKRLYTLNGNQDEIDWVYKAAFA